MEGEPAGGRGGDPEETLVRGERTLARVVDEPKGGRGESGASCGGSQEGVKAGPCHQLTVASEEDRETPRNMAEVSALQGWVG